MTAEKQFSDVSSMYGATMGRRSAPSLGDNITLFRVRMVDGDYDDGGAYWGGGEPLYCARDEDGDEQFTRARSYADAARKLGIEDRLVGRMT